MDQNIITPIRHSPILYKSFFHKQPYTSNIGAVTNVSFEHDTILVTIQIPASDITSKVKRIVVSDSNGIPVLEEDVPLIKTKFKVGVRSV